jgi:hypothetical protein
MPELLKHLQASQRLAEATATLLKAQKRLLSAYSTATQNRRTGRMNYLNRRMQDTNSLLNSLQQIGAEFEEPRRPRFVASSFFLRECFRDLTRDNKEDFFYITGSEIGQTLVLAQKCRFEHLRRTVVGVIGDPTSTHRLLVKLDQFGHRLLAHFHSHPGRGIDSTRPSGTDIDYQSALERAGYPTLAGIFSRDGFIRFFRLDENFDLQIHGKGVEHVQAGIYRLTSLD